MSWDSLYIVLGRFSWNGCGFLELQMVYSNILFIYSFIYLFTYLISLVTPTACGSFWARNQTCATAETRSLTWWATRELLILKKKSKQGQPVLLRIIIRVVFQHQALTELASSQHSGLLGEGPAISNSSFDGNLDYSICDIKI